MTDINKIAEQVKEMIPQVKFTQSGYEIRTRILEMAQSQVWSDYTHKWGQFETSVTREGNDVVTKVTMPEVPGVDNVLETAEKFYAFVNKNTK
jgi:hypothetical protein